MRRGLAVFGLVLTTSSGALGGGPLVFTTAGEPVVWDTTGAVPYHTDRGPLGFLLNSEARELVQVLFGPWENVSPATITFSQVGRTSLNVNAGNFGPFLGPFGGAASPLGQNVIAFDENGEIFDLLFGIGTGVLGFASPTWLSDGAATVPFGDPVPPRSKIIEGLAFLNGKWIDGVNDPGRGIFEVSLALFKAVFVHEFGHFAGLDHTQIHGLNHPPESDLPGKTLPIETMFPLVLDQNQATLERDDAVAISALYPTPDFFTSSGHITGRVLNSDGTPLSGVNVIARNLANDNDAVSYVSGANMVDVGEFFLEGLTPGAGYRIEVQEIDAFHTGGSRVGPFSPPVIMPGPPEFFNGGNESADPTIDNPKAFEPIIVAAGTTRTDIDIVLNRQSFSVESYLLSGDGGPNHFAIGDFDQDGIVDFVATQFGFSPGHVIRFYRGLGGGAFAVPVTVDRFPGNGYVVAGQFNRGVDDFLDIAAASLSFSFQGELRVYFGDGTGGFSSPTVLLSRLNFPTTGLIIDLAMGDLNGDPFSDLVALALHSFGPEAGATAYVFRGTASGGFDRWASRFSPDSGFPAFLGVMGSKIGIADFAGGPSDDIIGISSTTPAELGLLIGDRRGGFVAIPISHISNRLGSAGIGTGDFDENGTMDLVLSDLAPVGGPANTTRSFIDLLLGDGAGGFTLSDRYAVPESFQFDITVADFDNDGHLDIASTGASFGPGNPGAKVNVAFGDGAGKIRKINTVWGLPEFPTVIASGDLDGDQRIDLLVSESEVGAGGLPNQPAYYSVLLNQGLFPNQPPAADAGVDRLVECTSSAGAAVILDGSASSDPDSPPGTNDDIVWFLWFEDFGLPSETFLGTGEFLDVTLPIGIHLITLITTDSFGEMETDEVAITAVDTTPPEISMSLVPALLWPPNHRMVDIEAFVNSSDICSTPAVLLESVRSNEPDDAEGMGDGGTVNDIQGANPGTADFHFLLRAERQGKGEGRTYTVTYRSTDPSGNGEMATAYVSVPHDMGGVIEPMVISAYENGFGTIVERDQVSGAFTYNIVRGEPKNIRETDEFYRFGQLTCIVSNIIQRSTAGAEDPELSPLGEVFFNTHRKIRPSGTELVTSPKRIRSP